MLCHCRLLRAASNMTIPALLPRASTRPFPRIRSSFTDWRTFSPALALSSAYSSGTTHRRPSFLTTCLNAYVQALKHRTSHLGECKRIFQQIITDEPRSPTWRGFFLALSQGNQNRQQHAGADKCHGSDSGEHQRSNDRARGIEEVVHRNLLQLPRVDKTLDARHRFPKMPKAPHRPKPAGRAICRMCMEVRGESVRSAWLQCAA